MKKQRRTSVPVRWLIIGVSAVVGVGVFCLLYSITSSCLWMVFLMGLPCALLAWLDHAKR